MTHYPGTTIPVKAADLFHYPDSGKFMAEVMPGYPNSIAIPAFLAMVEFRASWGGYQRGAFSLLIGHPSRDDLILSATDLSRLNLTWRHIRRPTPGLHPWVRITWELTVPAFEPNARYYRNEDRFQHDLVTWTNRNIYRSS